MALLPTKQRDQILLMVIVLSLGAIGGYFMYMFGDKSQEITNLDTHVTALQTMNAKVVADIRSGAFDRARKEAQRFEKDLSVLSRLVPSSNEVPALLDQVSTAARRAGLELQDVAPAGPQPGEEFDTYKYKVGVMGGYHEIAQFLTNIATLDRIVAPMNVNLMVTVGKGEKKARSGESLLDAKFEIQTYVAHGSTQPLSESAKPTTQGHP
ncbi:MAG TPA: type 4a pilus biogenesis protein PilO [Gemmatimonadaceae bacterium]|nr:type 4a pilus biogenesis protein PilO [Gemmatimonadaceae bacterium]